MAQLEGGDNIIFNIDGRFLGFDKKLTRAPNAESIIRSLGCPLHFLRGLMDRFLVGFGITLPVEQVPAQGFEEGVEEFLAQLGFVVPAGYVGSVLFVETFHQLLDNVRCGH